LALKIAAPLLLLNKPEGADRGGDIGDLSESQIFQKFRALGYNEELIKFHYRLRVGKIKYFNSLKPQIAAEAAKIVPEASEASSLTRVGLTRERLKRLIKLNEVE
jgi:hypothetical protein